MFDLFATLFVYFILVIYHVETYHVLSGFVLQARLKDDGPVSYHSTNFLVVLPMFLLSSLPLRLRPPPPILTLHQTGLELVQVHVDAPRPR
jgi:hypothetical protein